MARQITLYRLASGEIVGSGTFSSETGRAGQSGCAMIEGALDASTHYVWEGEAEERPVMALTTSALIGAPGDIITVSGLPVGSSVAVNGSAPMPITGTTCELVLHEPATYRLTMTCWPYVPTSITVVCT